MKYQLVIQFAEDTLDYDEMIRLEDALISELKNDSGVDGHDKGKDEINYFILTEDSKSTFERCKNILHLKEYHTFKAAYRKLDETNYTIVWPEALKEFKIA